MKQKSKLISMGLACVVATAFADAASPAGLSKEAAEKSIAEQFAALRGGGPEPVLPAQLPDPIQKQVAAGGKLAIKVASLNLGGEIRMPFCVLVREAQQTKEKRRLFIAMHGGGKYDAEPGPHTSRVNASEFKTQISLAVNLYKPDGVYFIPRMADDRLGRWWHKHNQAAFDRVINQGILHWNVDPNRIYLLGISEGGYGTDILAPFMGDRLAGANAMAGGVGLGNPPANLRNLAFRTDVGEKDTGFDRIGLARGFHAELDRLHRMDPEGYTHLINVQAGRGHGIDYSQGIQWIAQNSRNPWPQKVVWINQVMDGLRRKRFHWVSFPDALEKGDVRVDAVANREANTITIDVAALDATNTDGNRTHGKDHVAESGRTPLGHARVDLLLGDALLDLDKPVTVIANGRQVFKGSVQRSAEVIAWALADRPDPSACPVARLTVTTP